MIGAKCLNFNGLGDQYCTGISGQHAAFVGKGVVYLLIVD